jgi:Vanillate O-demethylase oxygenase C-terminal domain/Rieske [2Fe-2S] domain
LFPLVNGRLEGDILQCGYHGFSFDRTGRCTQVPSQPDTPPHFAVRRYPVVEHGNLIWIWTGIAPPPRPPAIADFEAIGLGNSAWAVEQHTMSTIKARHQLLVDNLLDLSHISFVHSASIVGGGAVARIPCEIIEGETSLNVSRLGKGIPHNPLLKFLFPDHAGPVDQEFDTEFFGPHLIRTGGAIFGAGPDGPRQKLGTRNFLHAMTPETPSSVHYFVMTARDFRLTDVAIARSNLEMGLKIQSEDKAILESIEVNVDRFADTRRELSAAADAGAIRVRRRMAAQIRAESVEAG